MRREGITISISRTVSPWHFAVCRVYLISHVYGFCCLIIRRKFIMCMREFGLSLKFVTCTIAPDRGKYFSYSPQNAY